MAAALANPIQVRGPAAIRWALRFARDPLVGGRAAYDALGPFVMLTAGLPFSRGSRTVLVGVPLVLTAGAALQRELLSDAEAWRGVSVLPGGPKGSAARRLSSGMTRLVGARHAHYRKLILASLRRTGTEAATAAMAQIVESEIARWPLGATIDLGRHIRRIMQSISLELLFGGDTAQSQAIAELAGRIVERKWDRSALALPINLPVTIYGQILRESELLERQLLDWAASKRGKINDADLASVIVNNPDIDGKPPGDAAIVEQLASLLVLSSEGSESVLVWTLLLLATHPHVASALQEELLARLGRRSPSLDAVGELPYLDAVVKEAMRVLPPVPLQIRVAQADTAVAGHAVPKGTRVILNTFVTNRMPDVYPDGDAFQPERWLSVTPNAFEFPVFGAGVRACPGQWFGSTTVKIALAAILLRYRIDLPSSARVDYRVQPTFRPKDVVRAIVQPRDGRAPTAAAITGKIRELVRFPQ